MISNKLLFAQNQNEHIKYKSSFDQIFKKIILEWSKDLYVPQNILQTFVFKILQGIKHKQYQFTLSMGLEQIKKLLNQNNYKYYPEFESVINTVIDSFRITISLCNINNIQSIFNACQNTIFINSIQQIYDTFQINPETKSQCFKLNKSQTLDIIDRQFSFARGCLIIININNLTSNEINSYQFFQTLLDHELNHFFELLDSNPKHYKHIKNQNIDKLFIEVADKMGYLVNSNDFIEHIFQNKEFNSMCSDVCNVINFYMINKFPKLTKEQWYYKWLNMCNSKFLLSNECKQLQNKIQNVLLFSYACRRFSQDKWKDLKQHMKIQLNNPKSNVFKDSINWIKEFFKKV